MRRLALLLVIVAAACGHPHAAAPDAPEAGGGDAGGDAAAEPPGRLADPPVTPLAWQIGAPLAAGVVTGRIYDDLAAHAADRFADLEALGVRVIRVEIERTTSWDTYAAIFAAARAAGIEVLAIVSANSMPTGAPAPMDGTLDDFDHAFVPAYLAVVDEVIAQLHPDFLEVWNEPDNYSFQPMFSYPPCQPLEGATRYALLAVRVFETMDGRRRAGQTTPKLAAFGVSRQDDTCLRHALFDADPIRNHRLYYRPQHGLPDGLPADILAMHGYGNAGVAPSEPGYTYAGGTFADGVDSLLAATFADGAPIVGQLPIWYTEVGYSLTTIGGADPAARQADALATVYDALAARPRVTAAFWYDYRDDENAGPERFGLRDASADGFAPHPAYARMQAAASRADLAAPGGALDATLAAGAIAVTGWAIDADGAPPTIDLAIDGAVVQTVTDGGAPSAAACTVASSTRCPAVGFAASLPLPAPGVHEVAARATDGAGNARIIGRLDLTVP